MTDSAATGDRTYKQVWSDDLDAMVNLVERLQRGGKWHLMPASERLAFERLRRLADTDLGTNRA